MNLPLEFHPDVEAEVRAGHRWYEQSQSGLGREFLDAVERRLGTIVDAPLSRGVLRGTTRAALLSGFPYAIYYRVLRNRIRVVAVCHTSRDPSVWQTRQ